MFKLMDKARKNKKGFTLIEIIVVLVILAILIGAITPAMLRFIREARTRALTAEARLVLNAAQWVTAEFDQTLTPATDDVSDGGINGEIEDGLWFIETSPVHVKFNELLGEGEITDYHIFIGFDMDAGRVTGISYTKGPEGSRPAEVIIGIDPRDNGVVDPEPDPQP